MTLAYASKLGLAVLETEVWAQKIAASPLVTFGMVIAGFQMQGKFGRV